MICILNQTCFLCYFASFFACISTICLVCCNLGFLLFLTLPQPSPWSVKCNSHWGVTTCIHILAQNMIDQQAIICEKYIFYQTLSSCISILEKDPSSAGYRQFQTCCTEKKQVAMVAILCSDWLGNIS